MFPPFDEEDAFLECCNFFNQIGNDIKLKLVAQESFERKSSGVMLGTLICKNDLGEKIVLKTISGSRFEILAKDSKNEVFVKPIVNSLQIKTALLKNDLKIHKLTEKIKCTSKIEKKIKLKNERKVLTDESLEKVFSLYKFYCFDGTQRSLYEICAIRNKGKLPPAGTGECCAPRLLNYAFSKKMIPLSMCEVFYDESKIRENLKKYSPCDERCGILLPVMLGLEILYRDKDILVVNKQSGVLSVPGRGPDKQDCIVNRMKKLFPDTIDQPAVHRLDMETSGLMVLAFNSESHRNLSKQFENGEIKKEYVALLDGILFMKGVPESGSKELYFRLDVDNRPHQIWDPVYGKKAVTEWKVLGIEHYYSPDGKRRACTRILFMPKTGRTHQLRLLSADNHGFDLPIIGDTLYGKCEEGERLMLHASFISFKHPSTGKVVEFKCKSDF